MRFGYWTPTFGGWLRNDPDEGVPATFAYVRDLAAAAEASGFALTLVPELNLNDIKGPLGPVLDATAVAAGLAATTHELEIMLAVRPAFHPPALTARQLTTIQDAAAGRLSLNIVSAWWAEEARQYGVPFGDHDARYAVTREYVEVLRGLWQHTPYSFDGAHYAFDGTHLEPKPVSAPLIYAGGESEAGREAITEFADAYVTHGGTVTELEEKIRDMRRRRSEAGRPDLAHIGMSAFVVVRDTEEEAQEEVRRITAVTEGPAYDSYRAFVENSNLDVEVALADYSVSNRGLRPNLVGTPETVAGRIRGFEAVGVDTLLLQFSPPLEELQRFGRQVIPLVDGGTA
nr:LLM class flavin-dependent oxidoreductase [Microbacterium lemovicicum]